MKTLSTILISLFTVTTSLQAQTTVNLPYDQHFDEDATGWTTASQAWSVNYAESVAFSKELETFNAYKTLKSPKFNTSSAQTPKVSFTFKLERLVSSACAPHLSVVINDLATGQQDIIDYGVDDDFCNTEDVPVAANQFFLKNLNLPTTDSVQIWFKAEFYDAGYIYLDRVEVYDVATLGLIDQTELSLKVYPNPTNDIVFIDVPKDCKDCSYRLSNAMGQVIQRGSIPNERFSLELNGQQNGIYLFTLFQEGNFVGSKRIMLSQ